MKLALEVDEQHHLVLHFDVEARPRRYVLYACHVVKRVVHTTLALHQPSYLVDVPVMIDGTRPQALDSPRRHDDGIAQVTYIALAVVRDARLDHENAAGL
jgi:hypothetical protein